MNVINKIRSGCATEKYQNDNSVKIREIKELISKYENALENEGVFDSISAIQKASEYIDSHTDYYFLEGNNYTYIEEEYIKKLTGGQNAVTYLNKTIPSEINFRQAYGTENEIRFIADHMEHKKMSAGDIAVYYTSDEYENIISGIFGSRNIPFSLVSGYSAAGTNLVSFMINILKWAENGFLYKSLAGVMSNPVIDLKTEDCYAYTQFCKSADDSLVWGLKNYKRFIGKKRCEAEIFIPKTSDTPEKQKQNKQRHIEDMPKKIAYLNFLSDMTKVFIEEKSAAKLFSDLFEFTKKYTNAYYEERKAAYARLKKAADTLKLYNYSFNNISEKARFLREFLEKIKISDTELTNSILAIKLSGTEVLERKYNFFAGFSAKQFNSSISESPVLSDSEISELIDGKNLLSSDINKIKKDNFTDTLKTADNDMNIFVSSIIYDTVNMQPATPAPVFLNFWVQKKSKIQMGIQI